jgi:hypothetical protein
VREAEESGRRQAEHLMRLKQHAQFQSVMGVQSAVADMLLDGLMDAGQLLGGWWLVGDWVGLGCGFLMVCAMLQKCVVCLTLLLCDVM